MSPPPTPSPRIARNWQPPVGEPSALLSIAMIRLRLLSVVCQPCKLTCPCCGHAGVQV